MRLGLVPYGSLREKVVTCVMATSCLARHDVQMSDLNIAESTDRWDVVQNGVVSETETNVKHGRGDERMGPEKGGLNEYAG